MARYQYFRVFITQNSGDTFTGLKKIELFDGVGAQIFVPTPSSSVSASSSYNDSGSNPVGRAAQLFNGADNWLTSGVGPPHFVEWDMGVKADISLLRLYPFTGDPFGPAYAPRDFSIEGRNSPSDSWTTLVTVVGETGWAVGFPAGPGRAFSLPDTSSGEAKYWRVVALGMYGGSTLELSGIELFANALRVDAGASLSCTYAPSTGSVANLQDGSTTTTAQFLNASSPGFALKWRFADAVAVDGLRLGSSTSKDPFIKSLTLQSSDDDLAWLTYNTFNQYLWPGPSSLTLPPVPDDPSYLRVASHLHFDGANGSSVFNDIIGAQWAAAGAVQISTTQSKFGGSSAYFPGSATLGSAQVPALGNEDFTLETWVYVSGGSSYRTIAGTRPDNLTSESTSFSVGIDDSRAVYFYTNQFIALTTAVIPANTWVNLTWERFNNTLSIYIDGVSRASGALTQTLSIAYLNVGGNGNISEPFTGYIDEFRLTRGLARYRAAFTPRTTAFPDRDSAAYLTSAVPGFATVAPQAIASAADQGLVAPRRLPGAQTVRDMYFAGTGRVRGTVKIKGTPDAPAYRRVRLVRERDGLLVREQFSDAVTGVYDFKNIDETASYTVLSYDHLRNYRAVIADNLTPELMGPGA